MKSIASVDSAESLGATVRRARKSQGLTQLDLARKAGVSRSFIIDLEDRHPRAELGKVLAVLDSLGVSLAALTPNVEPDARPDVQPDVLPDAQSPQSDGSRKTSSAAYWVNNRLERRVQLTLAQQRLARERRARHMADLLQDWEAGHDVPDQETRRLVRDYIEGALSLDEAMVKVRKLSAADR